MSAASSSATKQLELSLRSRLAAVPPLWLALGIVLLVTAIRSTGTVDSDVAWQLWIAGRIHAGAKLYRDIIEVNPPLWFWMAVPLERAAAISNIRVESVLVVALGALEALSLAATDRLLHPLPPQRRLFLLSYGALVLAAMPWVHVGQREQIVLIGTLPYAALVAARRDRAVVAPWLAVAIGAGAALGFALKHYFLLVPGLLEFWLASASGQRWRPLRAEILALAALGAAYAAAILLFAPDFLTRAVPLVRLAYGSFGPPSLRYLFGPPAIVGLLLLGALGLHARMLARGQTSIAAALTLAAAGFAAVYFIQFKGWPYHAIPLIGCAALALAALLATSDAPPSLRIIAPALLLLPFLASLEEVENPALPNADVLNAVSGLRPGDPVAFLTTDSALPWSITLQRRLRYSSRYMGYWMLSSVVPNERRSIPDPRLIVLGRKVRSDTVEDFSCLPPKRIIVARPLPGQSGFDILPFFVRDARFAEILSHYRVRNRTTLETYEIASPIRRPSSGCRNGI